MRKTFAAVGQIGSPSLIGGGSIPIATEYQAMLDEFVTTPSAADQTAQNLFVTTLVDGAVWSELDRLFVPASHASGADSLLDWIHPATPGNVATIINTPTWTQYEGYSGDVLSKYINLNYLPNTDGVNYLLNNASLFAYVRQTSANTGYDIGCSDTITLKDSQFSYHIDPTLWGQYSTGKINQTNAGTAFGVASDAGMKSIERTASNAIEGFVNGVAKDNYNTVSSGIPTLDLFALAYNQNGSPTKFTERTMSMCGAGASLGAAKQLILYNAFQTLMTYYGTQV